MALDRYSPFCRAALEAYLKWSPGLHSTYLPPAPDTLDRKLPLFFVATHTSWWDAFVLWRLQRAWLGKRERAYTPMLERELAQRRWFTRLGALGIDPSRPASLLSAVHFLKSLRRSTSRFSVIYFPQGEIRSGLESELRFHRGVEVFTKAVAPATIVPVALHYEPLTFRFPSAFALAGDPFVIDRNGVEVSTAQRSVGLARDRLHSFLAAHGEHAPERWPGTRLGY